MLRFVPSTVKVGFVLGEEITRPVGDPLKNNKRPTEHDELEVKGGREGGVVLS